MIRLCCATALAAAAIFAPAKGVVAAGDRQEIELTAEQAVREALAANRDLQAARQTIEIARGRLLQAGRLSNPEFEMSGRDDFAFRDEGERGYGVGFSQSFPITGRLVRERDVARGDLEMAEAEVRDFARGVAADTSGAFYALMSFDRQVDLNQELIESVRRVERATARRLRAAEVSPAEVSLLRIERLRLEQEARRLRMDRATTRTRLDRLMARAEGSRLVPAGELDPEPGPARDPSDLLELARTRRPDLIVARTAIRRAESDRALAQAEIWQDWTVGIAYDVDRQVFDTPIGVKRDSFLGVGVTIPLPLWDRQQGRIASAEAEIRRARRGLEALTLRVDEEVRAAITRVEALRAGAEEYGREVLPESARTRELLARGYQQGLIGIAELIQGQRQDNEVRAFYLQLLGDLRQSAVDLEAATMASPYVQEMFSRGVTP